MIIAVVDNMTEIPESCFDCKLTEYSSGICGITKQSGQEIRPYNCPLYYLDDTHGVHITTDDVIRTLRKNIMKKLDQKGDI